KLAQVRGRFERTPVFPPFGGTSARPLPIHARQSELIADERALELSATGPRSSWCTIIRAAIRPPLAADIEMTKQIASAARTLGAALHDHISVGKGGHASVRGMKLI